MFGTDPLEELSIPDGTQVKEHDLVADGDVLVGGQSTVELGIRGGTIVAGERVTVEGDVEADGDCRLDMWCDIDGNVLVGDDAYLGERVHITGQLIVSGDLDIGDDVEIERGFEANGWIVIRNPMPTIVFLFVYLSHLLRVGEKEAAAEVADEFLSEDRSAEPVVIPRGARVSDDTWRVSTPASIGDACRLHGNIRATEIEVGSETEVFGSLRAKGPIRVGSGTVIHGDVTTRGGDVIVASGANVRGGISCERCELSEAAEVEGTIRARGGITLEDNSVAEGVESSTDKPPKRNADSDTERTAQKPAGERSAEKGTTEADPEVTPAVVPIDDGTLSASDTEQAETDETSRAFVPLETDETESSSAFVPIEESEFEWKGTKTARANRNGNDEDVATIIADAEDR